MDALTLAQAIRLADELRPNAYPTEWKVARLSALDRSIYDSLYLTHEDNPAQGFAGYEPDTPLSQALLVPQPYAEELYSRYLQLQLAIEQEESESYNLQAALYNNAYSRFATHYARTHLPKNPGRCRF